MPELTRPVLEPTADVSVGVPSGDGQPTAIVISGVMCTVTVQRMREQIAAATECSAGDVVFDLSGVEFIDGRGLALLTTARQTVGSRGHRCHVGDTSPIVRRLFTITHLDDLLLEVAERAS